ncbi:MAG: SusD/RagB family nutrient-binding outer membrane lipoprotein [Mesonia sp.]|uniref:SusD/RagB family nutrient-binding outer membrane lipoprotein n=1 Tax=Mesonia sp. TaxID=1960830 RepID=UPI003F967BFA
MKKYIKYVQVSLLALAISSCDNDNYLDVNVDPNNPTEVSPDLILPTAQNYTVRNMYLGVGGRYTNTFGNIMMANWSETDGYSWYDDEFGYIMGSNFYDRIFDYSYIYTLKTYQEVINAGDETTDNFTAIAEIMKAYHFQMLVDGYGDIPYFEALQRENAATPAYDSAEAIYDDLIIKLDEAITTIKEADSDDQVPGSGDIVFNGNMTSWIQFANTLKLRILVRQSGMSSKQAYIQENMNNIVAEGSGFLLEDALVNPGYTNDDGKQNPFFQDFGENIAGEAVNNNLATCASEFVIDFLQNASDPRIDRLYEEPAGGHKGTPQGLTNYPDGFEAADVSNIGPGLLKGSTQSSPIMLAAESLFLQAEAAQRGYLSGNAQALYEQAITASFNFLGADANEDGSTDDDAATYFGQSKTNVGWSSSDPIEAIITQKWIALNGTNGWESWVEYNRTGYPANVPVALNQTNADRPVRLSYPASERVGNAANVPNQPNEFSDKIFWAN